VSRRRLTELEFSQMVEVMDLKIKVDNLRTGSVPEPFLGHCPVRLSDANQHPWIDPTYPA